MEEVEWKPSGNSPANLEIPQIESAEDLSCRISEEYLD